MSIRKQILDPLSTLCKLAAISFYESGTKFSIYNNVIEIQKPEHGLWLMRRYRGDTMENVSMLYNSIIRAVQWYILQKDPDDKSQEQRKAVLTIIEFAIKGLRKLKSTYKEGNVCLALQFLINNLKMIFNSDFNLDKFKEFNELTEFEEDGILNYDKIKEIWNIDLIKAVSNQINLCQRYPDDINHLETLTHMLLGTDTRFKNLVIEMNSSL